MNKKTVLERFQAIKELEVADDLGTVADVLPYFCKNVDEALLRLEGIDNANPSKAIKILETLADDGLLNKEIGAISYNQIWLKNQIEVLKQSLLKAQEQEKENARYKKMLKILFKKQVDINEIKILISNLKHCDDVERCKRYNASRKVGYKLKQEEFDLLKEMLKDE